jgi:hypothetical protein
MRSLYLAENPGKAFKKRLGVNPIYLFMHTFDDESELMYYAETINRY